MITLVSFLFLSFGILLSDGKSRLTLSTYKRNHSFVYGIDDQAGRRARVIENVELLK